VHIPLTKLFGQWVGFANELFCYLRIETGDGAAPKKVLLMKDAFVSNNLFLGYPAPQICGT
jgi:hypothetical protein